MSYSNPDRRFYSFPAVNFGSGSAQSIKGPRGKAGRLIAIHASCTTLFTAVTTPGRIEVGTAADTDANALFVLGTLAATDAVASDDGVTDTDAIINADIAPNTQVEVTFVAPTGGTPAGVATVSVVIDWAD